MQNDLENLSKRMSIYSLIYTVLVLVLFTAFNIVGLYFKWTQGLEIFTVLVTAYLLYIQNRSAKLLANYYTIVKSLSIISQSIADKGQVNEECK